jgi:hypothetical protein
MRLKSGFGKICRSNPLEAAEMVWRPAGKSPDSKKPNCRNCRSDEPEGARSKTLPAVDALSYADHNLHKFVFKEA